MRVLIILLAAFALTACAPRGALVLDPSAAQVGEVVPIFVGTTRAPDPVTGTFGKEKSETVSFARFDVSVPPEREAGDITIPNPGSRPDPKTEDRKSVV